MKVKEIISETFGPGFASGEENGYGDMQYHRQAHAEEEEKMTTDMNNDYLSSRTSMSEFDIGEIRKMVMPAARKNADVKAQADEIIRTWEENLHADAYVDDEIFNKLFKQYEQLKDSEEAPLIKFNKIHALTKELDDAVDEFDNWKDSEDGDKWKDSHGKF